jgi:nucleoside-diphosphate-sugar epimerase
MNVHITGGTGFLGPFVVTGLIHRGHKVTALVRSEASARIALGLGATPLRGDLDQPESVKAVFAQAAPDVLVNVASLGFGHAPAIIEAAESAGIRRAVFVSTTSIFTGLNPASKDTRCEAERLIRASNLSWTIIRPTMIYGTPGDRNMVRLLRLTKKSALIPLPRGGKGLQQPVHVQDVAVAIVVAAESPAPAGRTYDVAGPVPLSLRKVCEEAANAVGRAPRFVSVPLWPLEVGMRLIEYTGFRMPVKSEQLRRLAEDKAFDISAAQRDLAFSPRAFRDGIRDEAAQLE